MKILPLLACVPALAVLPAAAQLVFTSFGTQTITFDSNLTGVNNGAFAGSGFQSAPSAGQLDSDAWATTGMSDGTSAFGGTATTGDFARGASVGGVTTGGFYGFDVSNGGTADRALGLQPVGDDWTPGTITLRLQNQTGGTLTALDISYTIYVLNNAARGNTFNFAHSGDDSSYSSVGSLDFTSAAAADGSPAWVATPRSTSLTGLSIPNNAFYYLRWSGDDAGGSGSRDEFALDDIAITAVPEPGATVVTGAGLLLGLAAVRRRLAGRA